jgi:hypothetical protein
VPGDGGLGRDEAPPEVQHFCKPHLAKDWRNAAAPPAHLKARTQASHLSEPLAANRFAPPKAAEPPCRLDPGATAVAAGALAMRLEGLVAARALKNVADMPWFGILEHWAGSVCLLHYATEWPWPHEAKGTCGAQAQGWNLSALTLGPAVGLPGPVVSAAQVAIAARNNHKGYGPVEREGWATCPVRVAERVLDTSATREFSAWLEAFDPALSHACFPPDDHVGDHASDGGATAPRDPLPRLAVSPGSPFHGFFADDPRGPDATLYAWAAAAFRERVRAASADLHQRGFSARHLPPFLSPDCFTRVAPDGFLVVDF